MTSVGQPLLSQTSPGTGYDWAVHYQIGDGEQGIMPIFDRETMAEVLDEASYWLDGASGQNVGTYEIIGIIRRDMISNASDLLGPSRPH